MPLIFPFVSWNKDSNTFLFAIRPLLLLLQGTFNFFSISFLSFSFFSKGLYLKDKTKEHQQKVQTEIVKLVFLLWIAGGKKENKLLKNIWYKSVSALCISIKTKWIIVVIISATSFTVCVYGRNLWICALYISYNTSVQELRPCHINWEWNGGQCFLKNKKKIFLVHSDKWFLWYFSFWLCCFNIFKIKIFTTTSTVSRDLYSNVTRSDGPYKAKPPKPRKTPSSPFGPNPVVPGGTKSRSYILLSIQYIFFLYVDIIFNINFIIWPK